MNTTGARTLAPGVFFALALALPAWCLGKLVPLVGGPVFGILLGMLLAPLSGSPLLKDGLRFTSKRILQISVVLLGFEMNLANVVETGAQSLVVMAFTITTTLLAAWLVGRMLKVSHTATVLIGVGTSICGGSAIAAVAPVIDADERSIAHAISTIFLFNIVAVFLFPLIGHLLHMSDTGFGIWAGTAVNDTSSVLAAGYSYSDAAGKLATIVKLTRTLMILPITFALSLMMARKKPGEGAKFNLLKAFPWFVGGFVAASVIKTVGILPDEACVSLARAGKFCIAMALVAIGLSTNLKQLLANGVRPILLGLACWAVIAIASLLAQLALGLF